jgi:two-component system, LytTR family, sensor kinase
MSSQFQRWFRIVGMPLFGIALYGVLNIVDPQQPYDVDYYQRWGKLAYCFDIVFCIVGSVIISELSLAISRSLDKTLPWERRPATRLLVQFVVITAASWLAIQLIVQLVLWLTTPPGYQLTPLDETDIRQTLLIGSLVSLLVNGIYTGEFFFRRWRDALLEAEALKRETLTARFEALKAQLDPHFLFNSLNTLTTLIEEEPKTAVLFVDKLAQVYRYVLMNRTQDTVPLRDELAFIEAYVYLAKMRFGDNLTVQISVNGAADRATIPPMALQMLLENALKHNIVSRTQPLHIAITETTDNQLEVRNTLQPKAHGDPSTGLGLPNIESRYRHLTNTAPQVRIEGREWVVRLPLLQ